MQWKEQPVLKSVAKLITRNGGVPIKMLRGTDGADMLAVIVSHDPSGPNHSREFHASLSASSYGTRRPPRSEEWTQVARFLGLDYWEPSVSDDKLTVHLWAPLD